MTTVAISILPASRSYTRTGAWAFARMQSGVWTKSQTMEEFAVPDKLFVGGDKLSGETGLVGGGGQQCGDNGDGGIVAADEVLGRVGDGRWERRAEGVDGLVVDVPGELEGEVEWFGFDFHGGNMELVIVSVNVSYACEPCPRMLRAKPPGLTVSAQTVSCRHPPPGAAVRRLCQARSPMHLLRAMISARSAAG
jgi:hypothetical protein